MNNMRKNIGFIGLGAMGLPMAKNLINSGFHLHIMQHRNPEPVQVLKQEGAHVHGDLASLIAESDIVITILPTDHEVESLLMDESTTDAFRPDTILLEMTSGSPDMIKKLHEVYKEKGIHVLDAPVSGGTVGAENGTLTVMAGGEQKWLDEVKGVMDAIAANVYHVGAVGAGNAIKAINQMLAGIHMIASAEAISLAKELHVDLAILKEVIGNSSGASWMLLNKMESIANEDFVPGFKLKLMKKDVQIAVDEGKLSVLPLASLALQLYKSAQRDYGELDFAAISKSIVRYQA